MLQNNAFARRRKPKKLLPKPPNAKRKQRQQRCASNGKKNEPRRSKQHVSKCNGRKKPKGIGNSAKRRNAPLLGIQSLLGARRRQHGDVLRHPPVHKRLRRPDRRAQLLLGSEELGLGVSWAEGGPGGREKRGKLLAVLLVVHPFRLPHLFCIRSHRERNYPRTKMDSSQCRKRRSGNPRGCRGGSFHSTWGLVCDLDMV